METKGQEGRSSGGQDVSDERSGQDDEHPDNDNVDGGSVEDVAASSGVAADEARSDGATSSVTTSTGSIEEEEVSKRADLKDEDTDEEAQTQEARNSTSTTGTSTSTSGSNASEQHQEDDLLAQKFAAIPTRHALGKRQSHVQQPPSSPIAIAKTTIASARTSRSSIASASHDRDRKFASVPTNQELHHVHGGGGTHPQRRSTTTSTSTTSQDTTVVRKFAAIPTQEELEERPHRWSHGSGASAKASVAAAASLAASLDNSNSASQPGAFAMTGGTTQHQQVDAVARMPPSVLAVHEQMMYVKTATSTEDQAVNYAIHNSQRNGIDDHVQRSGPPPEPLQQEEPTIPIPPTNVDSNHTLHQSPITSSAQDEQRQEEAREEAPMVVAELVEPPVHAVQVIFDEGTPQLQMNLQQQQQQQPQEEPPRNPTGATNSNDRKWRKEWWIGLAVLVLVIVLLAIFIPRAIKNYGAAEEESTTTTVPPVPITYPYECFRSTMDLFRAQIEQPNQTQFILCPATRIRIGQVVANPSASDTQIIIIDGDVPLMFLRSNVEVVCGLDGALDNNCILDGGSVQVLFHHPVLPSVNQKDELFEADVRTDNITIRGITFTGELISNQFTAGSSVMASNKGKNIRFVDCLWQDMTASTGLVFVGNNLFQEMAGLELLTPRSVELTLEDCTFRNIIYDHRLIATEGQSLTLRQCQFEDITLTDQISFCEDHGAGYYCHGLIYCERASHCEVQDIYVRNLEFIGLAAVLVASADSKLKLSGTYSLEEIQERETVDKETKACESGFGRFWHQPDSSGLLPQAIGCINQEVLDVMFSSSPTTATLGYDCYSSTNNLVLDQYHNPEQRLFIMCPNTTIKIGMMANPILGDFRILGGDFPLSIFRHNVEVRCGLDGLVEDRCVLDGGMIQVFTATVFSYLPIFGLEEKFGTDNLTIRGMTFTGQITGDATFGGASVSFSGPGRNQQMVDCLWENITCPQGLLYIGSNTAQILTNDVLEPDVVDLTITNSTFRNVQYDGPIASSWTQNLTVIRTRFENIRLLDFWGNCPWNAVGCQGLMVCHDKATCHLGDVCVNGLEYAGSAPIIMATRDSDIQLSGFHYVDDTRKRGPPDPCTVSKMVWVDYEGGENTCFDEGDTSLNLVDTCLLD
ncbi:expressed unknown protein [Seminavis robusta]|uniref:Uncharacterized protein n=1 Tax=Seminavis robusta TaxID=568900 RepID=A0A9N8D984_9STRA|nr:expressed unknown protein [Seminavis robusta]|eukprot:Sro21_g014820.1 n/a (1147) ;mRNA; r:108095-111662